MRSQSHQYSLLPTTIQNRIAATSKRSLAFLAASLLLLLALFASAAHPGVRARILPSRIKADGLEDVLGRQTSLEHGFTIVTPTYQRIQALPAFLNHYATGEVASLKRIVLQWVDTEHDPPKDFLKSLSSYSVPVIIERMTSRSLNERFRPSKDARTEAVLSIDDDLLFAPEDVELGYQTWKALAVGRLGMVGYFAREALEDGIYSADKLGTYR
jgi:hypothetical protein